MFNTELDQCDVGTAPLSVQIFRRMPKSRMSRPAALHLFRLLQRYRWCLAVEEYVPRWTGFWPRISAVERTILVHTVKAHCAGEFGRRLLVANLPADFEQFESDTRVLPITPDIEREFLCLLEHFGAQVGGNREMRAWVSEACQAEYAYLEAISALDSVFGCKAWVCPHHARAQCYSAYVGTGRATDISDQSAAAIEKALFGFYESCEGTD
jgi:hypothetical protein